MLNIGHRLLSEILGTCWLRIKLIVWSLRRGCECGANPDNLVCSPAGSRRTPPALSIYPIKANSYHCSIFQRGRVDGITALSASQVKRDMLVIGFK